MAADPFVGAAVEQSENYTRAIYMRSGNAADMVHAADDEDIDWFGIALEVFGAAADAMVRPK